MVEMVIILPILLMLLFALAEFGVVFSRWQTLSNAAREGARTAVVFRTTCTTAAVISEVRTRVKNYALAGGMTVPDADIAVTGACSGPTVDSAVTVTFDHALAVLPNFATSVSPTFNLVGTSTMRNEG